MKKDRLGQISIMFICIILGLMLAVQFKSVQMVGGNVSVQKIQQLSEQLQKMNDENRALKEQVENFKEKMEDFNMALSDTDKAAEVLHKDLKMTKMLAGLVKVEGPGIIVALDDKDSKLSFEEDGEIEYMPNIISHEDILKVVNELNAAGAEAISVNGERVVANTEIREAGAYININARSYSKPFEIKAIGSPQDLEKALIMKGGVVDFLSSWIDISIKKVDNLIIEEYTGNIEYKYVQPATEDEG
ncbi:MAG: DUF881 domain-containing protein [Clostridia bacterium]|nr:DUF881 domain-containing protein [Clostridia bacterium]